MAKTYKIGSSTAFALAYASAISLTVSESRTIVTLALTGAATLNLHADSKPQIGDEIIIKASSDGTARDLTFGTGFKAPVLAGVISKTKTQTLVYDGTSFIAAAAPVQID
jgi:hypothetical protein